MIGGTVITDIEKYGEEVLAILAALVPKSAGTTAAPAAAKAATSINVGVDPLPEATAALGTITAVTNLVAQRDKELNTPVMEQAATAQKLQDLRAAATLAISHAEQTGDFRPLQLLLS